MSCGVQAVGDLPEGRAVDVGDVLETHVTVAVVTQRLVAHRRAEVGPADADVDHIADALAGVANPVARPEAVGEPAHLVEDGVNAGDHVVAVDLDHRTAGRP